MIETQRVSRADAARYLAALNSCFSNWGDERTFAWAFDRRVSGPAADLMTLTEDGALLAGSAVTYRTIRTADGRSSLAGIMTGSWTLPIARGRGCFTSIINKSLDFVRQREGSVLLAYVTDKNPSYRRLAAAGSALFPTRYVYSSPDTPRADGHKTKFVPYSSSVYELFEKRRSPGATISYVSETEWASQFIDRPEPSVVVEAGSLGLCILDATSDTDRVQGIAPTVPSDREALLRAMLARAQQAGRKLFYFSADAPFADLCATDLGMVTTSGFLTMLPAIESKAAGLIEGKDPTAENLSTADAFARWELQSGDRM